MNQKQIFGVLVRAVGLTVCLNGLGSLWFATTQWALPAFREATFAIVPQD